jgi:hypothetical protein
LKPSCKTINFIVKKAVPEENEEDDGDVVDFEILDGVVIKSLESGDKMYKVPYLRIFSFKYASNIKLPYPILGKTFNALQFMLQKTEKTSFIELLIYIPPLDLNRASERLEFGINLSKIYQKILTIKNLNKNDSGYLLGVDDYNGPLLKLNKSISNIMAISFDLDSLSFYNLAVERKYIKYERFEEIKIILNKDPEQMFTSIDVSLTATPESSVPIQNFTVRVEESQFRYLQNVLDMTSSVNNVNFVIPDELKKKQ